MHDFGYQGQYDAFVCNGASRYRCTYEIDDFRLEAVDDFVLRDYLGEGHHQRLLAVLRDILADTRFALPSSLGVRGEQIVERGSMIELCPHRTAAWLADRRRSAES